MNKKYWLNEHGKRYWYSKSNMSFTACRAYEWVDRVMFIHESAVYFVKDKNIWTTTNRHSRGEMSYTIFKKDIDNWIPIENYDDYVLKLKIYLECEKYNIL